MALSEHFIHDDLHPIDMIEHLAAHHDWDFDRIGDDQIAMAVEGQWRTYAITIAWSGYDDTLRLICTFEIEPPDEKLPTLYHLLNEVNDQCWSGGFTYWQKQRLMVYRYGLVMPGTQGASPEQLDTLIGRAVANAERFYPAFQLVIWGNRTPADAIQAAIGEAYGRA